MAGLDDFLKRIDVSLLDKFKEKPFDPKKARQPFLKQIETTQRQLGLEQPVKGKKAFTYHPAHGGFTYRPLVPVGKLSEIPFGSAKEGQQRLTELKALVEGGAFDESLKALASGNEGTGGAPKAKRAGWSEQRRAAFAAAQAAKKK